MCPHTPPCPERESLDREAARTIVSHPEQGWSLLCNGIVVFEDTGELLPDGEPIAPHRPTDVSAHSMITPGVIAGQTPTPAASSPAATATAEPAA